MDRYTLTHLADGTLVREVKITHAGISSDTALLLAQLAEIDSRKLYAPAGYSSMFAWCVGELHMSEDVACSRIQAARMARRFPALFNAVAEGRLHLAAVGQLAPHLAPENATELIAAATHKSRSQIEHLLAERFPKPDVRTFVRALPRSDKEPEPVAAPSSESGPAVAPQSCEAKSVALALNVQAMDLSVPGRIEVRHADAPATALNSKVTPLSPQRFALQVTMDQEMRDLLRSAEELLGHQVPPGNVVEVLRRVLRIAVTQLQKRKFAAIEKPHPGRPCSKTTGRCIPTDVKRDVWKRDGGRCTFVSDRGHRCESRVVEFDHVVPYSLGGQAAAGNLRLRCRAHNQYEAERLFGTEFMARKRDESQGNAASTAASQAPRAFIGASEST